MKETRLAAILIMYCLMSHGLAQVVESPYVGRLPLLRQWVGPDGTPLPFEDHAQVLDFLQSAEIKDREKTEVGIAGSDKILLERDGLSMHAVLRSIDVYRQRIQLASGVIKLHFQDKAIFEAAAFELSLLLDFNYIPPTVERSIDGEKGTIQAWVEDARMETDIRDQGTDIPDGWLWKMQHQVMRIFDNLIYNEDRNTGNILFTEDWKMVLIDHTRAFRITDELLNPESIRYCERRLYEKLKSLDPAVLEDRLGPFLTAKQIESILTRRDRLIEHIDQRIAQEGERMVLFRFRRVEDH